MKSNVLAILLLSIIIVNCNPSQNKKTKGSSTIKLRHFTFVMDRDVKLNFNSKDSAAGYFEYEEGCKVSFVVGYVDTAYFRLEEDIYNKVLQRDTINNILFVLEELSSPTFKILRCKFGNIISLSSIPKRSLFSGTIAGITFDAEVNDKFTRNQVIQFFQVLKKGVKIRD